jgi:hypothetical protein
MKIISLFFPKSGLNWKQRCGFAASQQRWMACFPQFTDKSFGYDSDDHHNRSDSPKMPMIFQPIVGSGFGKEYPRTSRPSA